MSGETANQWAKRTFGATGLGDVRRTRRLVAMAGAAARRPSGKVSAVFDRAREREGAYDFLESPHVRPEVVAESMFAATASRAGGCNHVYVVIDGTALSLTDDNGAKGFGPVNKRDSPGPGIKVMNALAVGRDGVPLGLIDQAFWSRPPTKHLTHRERVRRNRHRAFEDKETSRFVEAARRSVERLDREGVRAWVVIDREGDHQNILLGLHEAGCIFTVRGHWNRALWPDGERRLDDLLNAEPSIGTYEVEIGRSGRRAARTARCELRAVQVTLRFVPSSRGDAVRALRLYAVRLREEASTGGGMEWLLYTNVPVFSAEHARHIIESYEARWRIEEFHRTWKQGECNVEDAQLRSQDAVVIWATVLSAVATRIERLKYLSRSKPTAPAVEELSADEIEALKLDRRRRDETRQKRVPDNPTISEVSEWIAELGGWIGKRNGPPGSITLARGLERLGYLVEGIALARQGRGG